MDHLLDYSLVFAAILGGGCYLAWRTRRLGIRIVTTIFAAALTGLAHPSPDSIARNVVGQRPTVPDSRVRQSASEYAWFATGVIAMEREMTNVDRSMWPERTMGLLALVFLAIMPPRRAIVSAGTPTGTDAPAA